MSFLRLLFFCISLHSTAQASVVRTPPLIQAVQGERMYFLQQLIKGGAEINAIDAWGRTAAHYAVLRNNLPALEFLLTHGADANLADNDGNALLDMWSKHENEKILVLLHEAGAKPLDLFQAAANNDRAAAERLLAAGEDAAAKNAEGKVPFMMAIEAEHYALAAILLKAVAGINGRDAKSWTPLNWAIFDDDWDLVREFIRAGADLSGGRSQNALDVATLMESAAKLIEVFIAERGVDATIGRYGNTLLMLAAPRGNTDIVELLIKHKADLNAKDSFSKTALVVAVQKSNIEIVKLLIKHQADVNIQDRQGRVALTWANYNKDLETVRLLIDSGADVNLPNHSGSTAMTWAPESGATLLMLAAMRGSTTIAKLLIEHHAEVNAQNSHGDSALLLTAKKGDTDAYFKIVELLIKHDAQVNAPNKHGETPLLAAALSQQPKTVELLIKHGAKVNAQNTRNDTALMRAAQFGYTEIVTLLIDNGADPNLKNDQGKTALDIAAAAEHQEVVAMLRAAQQQ